MWAVLALFDYNLFTHSSSFLETIHTGHGRSLRSLVSSDVYPSPHSMLMFTCSKPVFLPPTLHNSAGIPTQVSCHDRCRARNVVHFDCLFCIPDCARCACAERTASSARGYRRSCQGGTREGDPRDCASIDRGASEAQAEPYIEDQHWLRGQFVCTLIIETSL
jgi:hypothetical protein